MIILKDLIKLDGFDDVDAGSMIILKKMIGFYIHKIKERINLSEVLIKLISLNPYNVLVGIIGDKDIQKTSTDISLFSAIDKSFKEVIKEL